jgi:hypothetical protein
MIQTILSQKNNANNIRRKIFDTGISHVSAFVDTRPEVLATLERVSTVMAR